jgi:hypothetical protein
MPIKLYHYTATLRRCLKYIAIEIQNNQSAGWDHLMPFLDSSAGVDMFLTHLEDAEL